MLAAESAKQNEADHPRYKKSSVIRPLTEEASIGHTGTRYSISQRVHVLALHALCWRTAQIAFYLKIPERQVRRIVVKAEKRGYRPQEDPRILDHFVQDGLRPGRRPKENSNDQDPVCDPEPLPGDIAEDTLQTL